MLPTIILLLFLIPSLSLAAPWYPATGNPALPKSDLKIEVWSDVNCRWTSKHWQPYYDARYDDNFRPGFPIRSFKLNRDLHSGDEWMRFGRDATGPTVKVVGELEDKGCHTLRRSSADDPGTADYFTFSHQSFPVCFGTCKKD